MQKIVLVVVVLAGLAGGMYFGKAARHSSTAAGKLLTSDDLFIADGRYEGLPDNINAPTPFGVIVVKEPAPPWSKNKTSPTYIICARPEWCPYYCFYGPPLPEAVMNIDPDGYLFTTPEGIRIHRDGWLVTKDGRAFPAEEKLKDINLPGEYIIVGPTPKGVM